MQNLRQGYELDDVLLIPRFSRLESRGKVSLQTELCDIPIIASPMSGIVGLELIKELGKFGGIGILHRFYNDGSKRLNDITYLEKNAYMFGVAVGLNDNVYIEAAEAGASLICIDVANGYLDSVLEFTNEVATHIKTHGYNCKVMSGNVATMDGCRNLFRNGADIIRVGIGSGQLCITRRATGVGIPQFTAIKDCSGFDWKVVADGGIKNSGDAVKALAAGADYVMMGKGFARCFESDVDMNNNQASGMASKDFQEQFYGKVKKSVEGVSETIKQDIHLKDFIDEFTWNMKSAFTYLDSYNIAELHEKADFILTGNGSIK
jgi:IMP dehydrogenase